MCRLNEKYVYIWGRGDTTHTHTVSAENKCGALIIGESWTNVLEGILIVGICEGDMRRSWVGGKGNENV